MGNCSPGAIRVTKFVLLVPSWTSNKLGCSDTGRSGNGLIGGKIWGWALSVTFTTICGRDSKVLWLLALRINDLMPTVITSSPDCLARNVIVPNGTLCEKPAGKPAVFISSPA